MTDPVNSLTYRRANKDDLDSMYALIFDHGTNEWNFLPKVGVQRELEDLRNDRAIGIVAKAQQVLIGLAICYADFIRFPQYTVEDSPSSENGYIGDVVVHKSFVGQGIGTQLLNEAKKALLEAGVKRVYIDCHEENLASRGMMKKAAFKEVATYIDFERSTSSSRKTWLGCYEANDG